MLTHNSCLQWLWGYKEYGIWCFTFPGSWVHSGWRSLAEKEMLSDSQAQCWADGQLMVRGPCYLPGEQPSHLRMGKISPLQHMTAILLIFLWSRVGFLIAFRWMDSCRDRRTSAMSVFCSEMSVLRSARCSVQITACQSVGAVSPDGMGVSLWMDFEKEKGRDSLQE